MVKPTPIMVSREQLHQHFADPLPHTAKMRSIIRDVCMPLVWQEGIYITQMLAQPHVNREFVEKVDPKLQKLFAKYTIERLTDTSQHQSMPADILRKILSFTYHIYNENDPKGAETRAFIQKTANELRIPELLPPDNFFTSKFNSDQLVPLLDRDKEIPLEVAIHSAAGQMAVPAGWFRSGDTKHGEI